MKGLHKAAFALVFVAATVTAGFLTYRSLPPSPAWAPKITRPPSAERVPNLTLPDLEGRPRELSEWKGRPLLINFWATWCEPCRKEIPLLKKLRMDYASEGLEVLGLAIDFRDPVAAYVREAKMGYPILIAADSARVTQAFGVGMGLPTTVFVARDGRIVAVKVGELHAKRANRLIQQLLEAP